MSESDNWITVAELNSLDTGSVIGVRVGEVDVALYNIDGEIYATHNICTHAHAFLSDGWLEGDVIECPLHGGRFEAKTGKGLGPPIPCDMKTFPVRIVGNLVQVDVS